MRRGRARGGQCGRNVKVGGGCHRAEAGSRAKKWQRAKRSVDGGVRRVGLAMGGGGDRRQCWAQCVGARLRGLERKGMKSIRKGIRARQER